VFGRQAEEVHNEEHKKHRIINKSVPFVFLFVPLVYGSRFLNP